MKSLVVEICTGTSCHLLGSEDLLQAVDTLIMSKRERIELREVSCLKSCRQGPTVRIDGVILTGMTPDRLLGLIDDSLAEA